MAIEVASSFERKAGVPLDDREVLADITARDAIPLLVRYEGMKVTVLDDGNGEQKLFWLKGGITNGDWEEFSSGGSGTGLIVSDITERNAIPNEDREIGMTVTVLDDGNGRQKDYWLVGGITNANWEEKKSGGGILTVATKAALDAVPAEDKYDGLMAFQLNDRILWEWDARYSPRWVMFAGTNVVNTPSVSGLSSSVRSMDNYIYINATEDLVSPQEPFGSGLYNQLNAKVTVINNSDFSICLRGGGGTWRIEGDDVWLSAKGHSATFLKAANSWILIGRSN